MLEQLLSRWNGLSVRDRRTLTLAATFLAIVLVWLLAFEPAWKATRRLDRELPRMRADLAQLDALSLEAQAIAQAGQGSVEPTQQLRARLQRSLEDAGLGASLTQMEVNGDLIEARFSPVEFNRWLYWLEQAVRDTRLRVVDLAITRESPGSVSGRVALEAPRAGGDR